jgi:protein-S-isoprenylcysteine O-methyltransferase Ste14
MSTNQKSFLFVIIQFLCGGVLIVTGRIKAVGYISASLMALSGLLFCWALAYIKPSRLKATPPPAENMVLIQTGPYRFIRHPMYTAALILTLVWAVDDFSFFRLTIWLVLLINLILKLLFEEELLVIRFPEYKTYMRSTKRLIPFIF